MINSPLWPCLFLSARTPSIAAPATDRPVGQTVGMRCSITRCTARDFRAATAASPRSSLRSDGPAPDYGLSLAVIDQSARMVARTRPVSRETWEFRLRRSPAPRRRLNPWPVAALGICARPISLARAAPHQRGTVQFRESAAGSTPESGEWRVPERRRSWPDGAVVGPARGHSVDLSAARVFMGRVARTSQRCPKQHRHGGQNETTSSTTAPRSAWWLQCVNRASAAAPLAIFPRRQSTRRGARGSVVATRC
jgi:hypothetical protein